MTTRGTDRAALHVHRSERADALAEALAGVLVVAPSDPFTPEVVAVPTRGVERWLAQRLSHHLGAEAAQDGVCANVTFPSPLSLVGEVLSTVTGVEPGDDPWQPDRVVWPILEVVDAEAGAVWCAALDRHLGAHEPDGSYRRARRYGVARRVAQLFASYAAQRPSMLQAWARGELVDGAGHAVPDDLVWQPELWRRVRAHLATASPAERLDDALARLRAEPGCVELPDRLSVFGPTRLPEDQLQVLAALSEHRDVHLWLLQPSPVLWSAAVSAPAAARASSSRRQPAVPARHPLLASLGRDAVELAQRLASLGARRTDTHHPAAEPPRTLLGALQRELRADAPTTQPIPLEATDRSVQVHACHGRARQVEVLRETLLQLFAADDTLEPRDILVMCPDVEEFAPLVGATFGLAPDERGKAGRADEPVEATHPGHRLRVRVADRSPQQTNPLLGLLAQLLGLADGRVTASEVLDLVSAGPVRRCFGLDDDAVDRIRDWAVAAGTRWGEDRSRRARFGLEAVGQGTWEATLDRILLGAAMADEEERFIGTAVPLDDVDSSDLDLAGRLAELVDRLAVVLGRLDGTHPLQHWLDALDDALDLLTATGPAQAWQTVQARRVLADARLDGAAHGVTPLRLPDVRALLGGRLEGRPTRASFRTGHLTMCSMVPMRSVPHRVVCLLGMDDGAFPRGPATDGDDVLLREPLIGERDRRSEDRQLFLDAVLAATDHLVLLYSGADERTGARRAPAVPVGELLDTLERTALAPTTLAPAGAPAREHVVVHHPLQPFDPRAFTPGALGTPGPASFDVAAFAGARAALGPRTPPGAFLARPLPDDDAVDATPEVVELDDLVRFLEHPVRAFLRQRLGVVRGSGGDDVDDRLPLDPAGLEAWAVGDRLLAARLSGADPSQAQAAEWRRGKVPPGSLGAATLTRVMDGVEPIVTGASRYAGEPATVDVAATLASGCTVTGTVPVRGGVLLRAVYSALAPKHRVRAWAQLLALTVAHPETTWSAVTIGRGGGQRPSARQSVLAVPSAFDATVWLEQLVDLLHRGLREPLPLAQKTSAAYASSRSAGDTAEQAVLSAWREWEVSRYTHGEAGEPEHVLVWGDGAPLTALLAAAPAADEETWWLDETSRFGSLARRVWQPLLDCERMEYL